MACPRGGPTRFSWTDACSGVDTLATMIAASEGAARDLSPQLDPTHLAVVRYPTSWEPPKPAGDGTFFALIRGEHEVTVVGPERLLDDERWAAAAEQVDRAWRRITFPGPLPWE